KWKGSAFEIGSHGFSHQKITQMTEDQARFELRESKKKLQDEFNTEVSVYAFTYGDTSILHARFAFEEGYDYAVNTDTGGLLIEDSPYQIFRVNIFPNETIASLRKKTSSWYRKYYYLKRNK
ncbi:MAG: polysaccharide deacetylase family protein, partial [Bdellovibrio sp.]|nr:polysaccharide deacetylase family protein [Bdellovibrio sp.]